MACVEGDIQDRGLAEGRVEEDHGERRGDGGWAASRAGISFQRLAASTREWAGISAFGTQHNSNTMGLSAIVSPPIEALELNTSQNPQGMSQCSLSFALSSR